MCGVLRVTVRSVSVVSGLLMVAALVMLRGFPMMAGGMLVMVSSVGVVLRAFVLGCHGLRSSGCGFSLPSQGGSHDHNLLQPSLSRAHRGLVNAMEQADVQVSACSARAAPSWSSFGRKPISVGADEAWRPCLTADNE